jgi:hypothetical protein
MRMRIFLIIFIILNFLGGVGSVIIFSNKEGSIRYDLILMITAIYTVNLICARYLYNKSSSNKIEWALFGILGNVNAIIVFHVKDYVVNQWKNGKSIMRD